VFRHDDAKENSICGNFINSLLLDGDGIWIGTRSSGLCFYDTKNNSFFSVEELSGNDIIHLQKDTYGNVYATLGNDKIAVIHRERGGKYKIVKVPLSYDRKLSSTGLFISKTGMIWVGTKEGRLFYSFVKKSAGDLLFREFPVSGIDIGEINVINSHRPGELWAGTRKGLYRFDVKGEQLKKCGLLPSGNDGHLIVYDIQWKNDDMWVASGSGLYVVKDCGTDTASVTVFKHKELNENSISNNTVTGIYFDNKDQAWVGTGKFLNLFYNDPVVNVIKSEAGNPNSLNSNVVFSIRKYGNDMWVGTSGGGLNLIRGGRYYAFTRENVHLPSNVVFSTEKDDKGNLWVGTKEGLSVIRAIDGPPRKMKIKNILHLTGDETSLSNNFIRQVYKDWNGDIWVCTYNGGLNRFTGDTDKNIFTFRHYRHPGVLSDRIYCIRQTGDHEYWVGTIKGLILLSFDGEDLEIPVFRRLRIGGTAVLEDDVIYDIMVSRNGRIWLGTRNGLFMYDRRRKELQRFGREEGMPNNVVYGILEDDEGNIWLSTNKGISCFKGGEFINYTREDGFADKEFNLQARFKDDKGNLYFGGINGISFFDPGRMGELDRINKLYFNGLLLTNVKTNRLEETAIARGKSVRLKSNEFPFYVKFSNINLSYHKNTGFAYRLKPDDNKWNFIGKDRQIQFLRLAPGNYTLEIQGVSRNKVWQGADPLKMSIVIVPPWWRTGHAYFLYLILFLSVTYIVYRFNLKRHIDHQERLRLLEIDELKTNFYTNITHELRTPLTVILGVTEDISEELDESEKKKYRSKLNVLARNSKKLLQLINQVLDLSKVENNKLTLKPVCDDVIHFLKVITESFHSLAKHKNIEFVYYNETESLCMDFDREKFLIVISNLLSNAIKFTPEYGKIILHVKSSAGDDGKETLVIKVKDTGIGVSEEDQKNIFDRFFQVKSRDKDVSEGTGIGLAIVKEYINLMNGTVEVESREGKGTVFTIRIPVTRKAPKEKSGQPAGAVNGAEEDRDIAGDGHIDLNSPVLLIVEDNKDVADYIASCIDSGYQIIFARNGDEGIEKAVKYIPDIIITDLLMPDKDGLEMCNTLKNGTATSHIPIIMLTARSLEQDKLKGYSAGADAYLIKPFNKKELLVRIKQLTELRKKLQQKYSGLAMQTEKPVSLEDEFLNTIFSMIDKNIDDTEYKSAILARDMGLSESQLYRKIKAITNVSTAICIRNFRLEKAKEMLKDCTLNISEIAYRCGFNDPAWFAHAFKEKYKVSPSEYRS
jgi:signal transduction histidine kinase/ligand-binding sensor domain-containing protein/DNA-binding response OmpR family regulator